MLQALCERMNRVKSVIKWSLAFIGTVFLVVIFTSGYFMYETTYSKFNKIENGMSNKEVIAIFEKEPDFNEITPFLCAEQHWYGDCVPLNNSSSEFFYTFKVGIETYAIIGFTNNRVVVKGLGDA